MTKMTHKKKAKKVKLMEKNLAYNENDGKCWWFDFSKLDDNNQTNLL